MDFATHSVPFCGSTPKVSIRRGRGSERSVLNVDTCALIADELRSS